MDRPKFLNRWNERNEPAAVLGKGNWLPNDLTEWVGSFSLIRQTLEAIDYLKPVFLSANFKTSSGAYRPQMLLTLMTYSYAKGLTGSRDIELAIPNDKAMKYICASDRPDWNVLRRFRRQYQQLIQSCLTEVAKRAWENQFPARALQAAGSDYVDSSLNRWMTPARPDFAAEAARRMRLSILADTLLSDE
jgi:transposase